MGWTKRDLPYTLGRKWWVRKLIESPSTEQQYEKALKSGLGITQTWV